jgi:hypothetical protein
MRIAKPLLLVATPIAVVIGINEAFRLAGGLAFLMIALLLMISAAMGMLVATIRKEQRLEPKTSSAEDPVAAREIP